MNAAPLVPPEMLAGTRNRWDVAVEALLAVLLAFMPLAFGAVDAWSELIALAIAAVLVFVVLARAVIDRTFALTWTWAYAPLAAFALVVVLQMTPLPRSWVAALSPAAAATPVELLGADAAGPTATLSMYPLATAHGLRLVLVGAAVFFVTATVFRTAPQIRRLLTIVFVIGCVQAAVALLQIVTHADRLYWTIDAGTARLTSGSFINYSNFSQFMNLSIGAGVALVLVRLLDDRFSFGRRDDPSLAFGGASFADHGSLLAGLVLSIVAVFASLSRNGALSLTIAALIVGAALFLRGTLRRRGWVLAVLPLAALAVLLVFGFDVVYDRLATLGDNAHELASRWDLTLGTLRAWREFPLVGAGLGTHEFVFPMFDDSGTTALAGHADNDYAQLLEETGVVGAAFVALFVAIIAGLLITICRRGRSPISAAAFGLALGLIAVAIHSATDFGQHVPAVFSLSAVACGLAVQLSRLNRQSSGSANGKGATGVPPVSPAERVPTSALAERQWHTSLDQRQIFRRRGVAVALTLCVAATCAWAIKTAYSAHVAEQWWAAALLMEDEIAAAGPKATDNDYAALLAAATQAAEREPQNVLYAYWLNAYRWRSIARQTDPATGQVLLRGAARPIVAKIADELAAARRLCPTFGPPYGFEGQLRLFVLGDAAGGDLIRKGVRLAPYDPPTCLIAGELAAREGRVAEADSLLRRAFRLAPNYFPDVVIIALDVLKQPGLPRELASDDYNRLEQMAAIAAAREEHAALADELRRDAESALRRRVGDGRASARELASLAMVDASRGKHAAAAVLYRDALLLEPGQFDWRFARAQALAAAGDDAQALREIRACLAIRPTHAAARQLADDLSLRVSE